MRLLFLLLAATALQPALAAVPNDGGADADGGGADPARHPATSDEIVVTANARNRADLLSSVTVLSGDALQEDKRQSLGETLAAQPGVTASSFGPTASRPILRGLGGDRIRVLTDGIGSFDASATSADHAVAVNALTAERIEVIRGPAALLYGSSAIGGVVNVIDTRIPRHVPDEPVHAQVDSTYGTAAKDRNVDGAIDVPIGKHWVAHLDGSFDDSNDLDTGGYILTKALREQAAASPDPAISSLADLKGKIPNTQARSWDVAGGLAYIADDGSNIGVSVAHQVSLYGVPIRYSLDPAITDGSPRIDLRQTRYDFRSEVYPHGDWIDAVKVRLGYGNYRHDELEKDGSIGTSFFDKGMEGRLDIVQARRGPWSGEFGGQVLTRDFSVTGAEQFLPPNATVNAGVFGLERLEFGAFKIEAGGRVEHENASARADDTIGNAAEGSRFTTYSGSLGAGYSITQGYRLNVNLTHTERSPDAEELFSNGPHDGTQAYEFGNPALAKEKSNGVEVTAHAGNGVYSIELSGYYNHFSNFIFQSPTGAVRDDLPVYAYLNGAANQLGFEAQGDATVARTGAFVVKANAQADYVRITVRDFGPAPLIPPLRVIAGLAATSDHLDLSGGAEHDFEHDRIADNETPTKGFTLVNAAIAWRPWGKDSDVTFRLTGDNLADAVARRSTSLLKDYAPLAGRDIRLGVSFRI